MELLRDETSGSESRLNVVEWLMIAFETHLLMLLRTPELADVLRGLLGFIDHMVEGYEDFLELSSTLDWVNKMGDEAMKLKMQPKEVVRVYSGMNGKKGKDEMEESESSLVSESDEESSEEEEEKKDEMQVESESSEEEEEEEERSEDESGSEESESGSSGESEESSE